MNIFRCIYNMLLVTLICCGCNKDAILGYQPKTQLELYDAFWSDMNDHYALFEQRNVDWNAINTVYRPQINATTTDDELWNLFCDIVAELNDAHTYVRNMSSGVSTPNGYSLLDSQFSSIQIDLLLEQNMAQVVYDLSYGKVANANIGYLYINQLIDYDLEAIDELVAKVANCDAFIIDLRQCQGGSGVYAVRLASYFVDNNATEIYYQIKSDSGENEFSEKVPNPHYINNVSYADRPVVVLTSSATVSAGEWLTAILKTSANVTQVGLTTNGSFSVRSLPRYLPNGWQYYYSSTFVTLSDGTSPEGVGCVPDIEVANRYREGDTTEYMMQTAINLLTNGSN